MVAIDSKTKIVSYCCEDCKHFDLHPFIREGDWTCYCNATDLAVDPYDSADDCKDFEEIEE